MTHKVNDSAVSFEHVPMTGKTTISMPVKQASAQTIIIRVRESVHLNIK